MAAKGKFCRHCGKKVNPKAEICPKCGVRLKRPPKARAVKRAVAKTTAAPKTTSKRRKLSGPKNAALAAILSLILPGLGQIYNGQIGRGITFIIIIVILGAIPFILTIFFGFLIIFLFWLIFPIIWIISFAFWMYNIYDAYKTANKINTGEM
jgi:TM2 domain-containing membrane protein YozV